ncbi:MAG: kelch repeat-containing protein, partial [Chitinophagales bacterium]
MPSLYRRCAIILLCLFSESPCFSQWTWMKGDSIPGNSYTDVDSFGEKGVFTDSMIIPKLYGACGWRISNEFYLLGGEYYSADVMKTLSVNAMWKFNIDTNKWKWIAGSGLFANTANVYGIQGVPDSNNFPGQRVNAAYWTDLEGNFWLFGGIGWGGWLNDLWKYDISTKLWTW